MLPEQQETFKVQMAEQRAALRSQKKRETMQMAEGSTMAPKRLARVTLLKLPPEILIHILLHLPFTSVVICQAVSCHFQVLISESVELQYYIHLGICGMVDNPRCSLPVSGRLNRLLVRERRWEDFDFDFCKIIDAPVVAKYRRRGLSAGVFSILYENGVIRQIRIPSEANQQPTWKEIHLAPLLINPGTRMLEQDLQVLVTAQSRTVHTNMARPHTTHEIQVHLKKSSTGEPHPDAQQVISFETREEFGEPWAAVECFGDNLLLTLRDDSERHKPDDQIYLYGWKTGELKMRFSAPFHSYHYPLILTPHTFLLPNATTGELEYWRIPQSPSGTMSNQPFFILSLPPLCPDKMFDWTSCRAEPSPTNVSQGSSRPFYTDPCHAIAVFHIAIRFTDIHRHPTYFMFFVHRSSLVGYLDTFSASISFDERPTPVPYDQWGPSTCRWFNHSINGHQVTAAFGQRFISPIDETPGAPLTVFNFNPTDVSTVLGTKKHIFRVEDWDGGDQHADRNEGRGDVEGNQPNAHVIQGSQYRAKAREGPSQPHEICALEISPDPSTQGSKPDSSSSEPRSREKIVIRGLNSLDDPYHCFEGTVYSSLPYTMRSSQDNCNFEDLFLDEECILGSQTADSWDQIKQVHVLHYG